jgi:hypothetical protein
LFLKTVHPPPLLKSSPPQHRVAEVVREADNLGEMAVRSMRRLLELELLYDDPYPKRRLMLKHVLRGDSYEPPKKECK